jgi:hypothetical protein
MTSPDKLVIRIRRVPFLLGILAGMTLLGWSVNHSFHSGLLRGPHGVLPASPKMLTPPRRQEKPPPVARAHEGWLAMRAFEHYMDSLRGDSSGRRRYDSILFVRPGILDSARKAEEFFYSHDH